MATNRYAVGLPTVVWIDEAAKARLSELTERYGSCPERVAGRLLSAALAAHTPGMPAPKQEVVEAISDAEMSAGGRRRVVRHLTQKQWAGRGLKKG